MSNNLIEIYYFCSINWYLQVAICCGFLRLVLDSALTVSTWRKSWFIIHPSTHPHMINELSWSLLLIIDYWLLIIDYWLLIIDYWLLQERTAADLMHTTLSGRSDLSVFVIWHNVQWKVSYIIAMAPVQLECTVWWIATMEQTGPGTRRKRWRNRSQCRWLTTTEKTHMHIVIMYARMLYNF